MNSGKSHDRKRLGKRDRAILQDVRRYRVLTNELVHLRHLASISMNATTKVTQRLTEAGWLARQEYTGGRWYFVAGKKLCQQHGLPLSRTRPLGTQSLTTTLALADYCLKAAPNLCLLHGHEIQARWSWITPKLQHLPHAIEPEFGTNSPASPLLRLIRVDLGGTPAHVAQKCKQDFKARTSLSGFAQLLRDRHLLYVVLTATETKKQLIIRELKKREWPNGTRFEVAVVPELCLLLT